MGIVDRVTDFFARRAVRTKSEFIVDVINKRMAEIRRGDSPDANGAAVAGKIREWFKIVKRKLGFDRYYNNPYDFRAMRTAFENEVYIRRSVDHYTESVMRNGYEIVGETEDDVLYIKRRLAEMEMVSGLTTADCVRECIPQLLLYGNLFPHLIRSEKSSSGTPYRRFDSKQMTPIAAVLIEDARAMKIKNDSKRGLMYERDYKPEFYLPGGDDQALSRWANVPLLYSLTYGLPTSKQSSSPINQDDIYHIGFHRHPGDVWATPPFAPVLDDIRTLRLIEENVELIVFQYGHPILHGRVGTKEKEGTKPEVDNVSNKIESMDSNGFIVTSNRVELDFKGGGEAVDLHKYLEYFKNRVFSGLYMSDVAMGESDTSTRSTADFLSKDSVNRTTELQLYIQQFYSMLFKELMLERGLSYRDVNHHSHHVSLIFPEVDIESKIKTEEHYTNMFVQNTITIDEAREKMGFKPITDEELQRTFAYLITMKESEQDAELQERSATSILRAKLSAGLGAAKARNNGRATKANNKTNQRLTPRNQYGRKTTPSVSKK